MKISMICSVSAALVCFTAVLVDACGSPSALTSDQIVEALAAHNQYRASEGASNEIQLTWDSDLADMAQAQANTCSGEHGNMADCSGTRTGQNLYKYSFPGDFKPLSMNDAVPAWMGEKKDWDAVSQTCNPGVECRHYTQVVWARSAKVGCGYSQCGPAPGVNGLLWYTTQVYCNYGPPGNVEDNGNALPPYTVGAPCSNCDSDHTGAAYTCANNLCVAS